jgi:hypothetical protein
MAGDREGVPAGEAVLQRVVVACLFVAALAAPGAAAAAAPAGPMPSLTPAATDRLWHRLVDHREHAPRATLDDCRPARVVVYAQTDWLRVATLLAQNASPCAQYYVSVPPIATNKAQPRGAQAAKIRALGANFHALAEINWNGWNRWVTTNQSNWAQAGIVARQRMAAAGYDVAAGDTWAVNELTTAVRKNTGVSRQNVRDFLRGLYEGDGTAPQVKGVVFAIGTGQTGFDPSAYKATLESWFEDAGFWGDVAAYVSDWGQEVYGDVRAYAVSGATPQQRRDALVQYLAAPLALARSAPATAGSAATTVLDGLYLPLGNAAWAWRSAYGWTQVPVEQMQDYVSAQVYAQRALASSIAAPVDRIGFAWAPSNTLGLGRNDFTRQSASLLQRLGQAIRDSAATIDPADPGIGACGPAGQPSWCSTIVGGAVFTTAWADFATWTPSSVAFTTQPFAVAAGAASAPLTLQLQTGSTPTTATVPTAIALASSSASGVFATSPAGPWTPTLNLTLLPGQGTATFYYEDTLAGTPTITATVPGQPGATQTETVTPGPPVSLTVTAPTRSVLQTGRLSVAGTAKDQYGNSFPVAPTWSVVPAVLGTVVTSDGASTFVPGHAGGRGRIVATVGGVTGWMSVNVVLPPPRVVSATSRFVRGHLVATVVVRRGTLPARGVALTVRVRKGSSPVALVHGRTDKTGRFVWRSKSSKLPHGHYVVSAKL